MSASIQLLYPHSPVLRMKKYKESIDFSKITLEVIYVDMNKKYLS